MPVNDFAQDTGNVKNCTLCGVQFQRSAQSRPSRFARQKYCSRSCNSAAAVIARRKIPMHRVVDISGQRYGSWTAINHHHSKFWECLCDCGTVSIVESASLRGGNSKSCGCAAREIFVECGKRSKTHGMTKTPEYAAWKSMKDRCGNPNLNNWHRYGGRGIKVCGRWLNSFENFIADMGMRPSVNHSMDRIDNDGNYEPGNCRWATAETQQTNKSTNRIVVYDGVGMTISAACAIAGVPRSTVATRINSGYPEADWFK